MDISASTPLPFWKRQLPFLQSKRDKWILVLFSVFYAPFFLIVFQPFGVNNYDPTHEVSLVFALSAMGFGLMNGITLFVYEFGIVPLLFRKNNLPVFVLRIILALIFLSSTTFLFYNFIGNFHDWSFKSYLGFIRDVSLMGVIPFGVIFLYFSYRDNRKAYLDLQKQSEELIWLKADNGKDKLGLTLEHLLFIEAQDNYVAVFHRENESVKKSLLRTTMKKLESQLQAFPVVRCHRSFLINISSVQKVTGNNHQLKLHIERVDVPIPVSRSYIPLLEEQLDIHHK